MPIIQRRIYKKAIWLFLQTGFLSVDDDNSLFLPHSIECAHQQRFLHKDMFGILRVPCELLRCFDVSSLRLYLYLITCKFGPLPSLVIGVRGRAVGSGTAL